MPSKFEKFYTRLYDGGKFLPSPHKRLLESFATWQSNIFSLHKSL